MVPGFTLLSHPADLGIEARGRSVRESFEVAARALISVMVDAAGLTPRETREVDISASDREQLLVLWLSEVLYLFDAGHFITVDPGIAEFSDRRVRASIRGERLDPARHVTLHDVKAVTYHGLHIEERIDGAVVRVTLDM